MCLNKILQCFLNRLVLYSAKLVDDRHSLVELILGSLERHVDEVVVLVEVVLTEHLRPLSLLVANCLNLFANCVECLLIFSVLSVALALSIICIDESTQSLEFTLGSSELLEHI